MNKGTNYFGKPYAFRDPLPLLIDVFNEQQVRENAKEGERNWQCVLLWDGYLSDFKDLQSAFTLRETIRRNQHDLTSQRHDQAMRLKMDAKLREARAAVGKCDEPLDCDVAESLTWCFA